MMSTTKQALQPDLDAAATSGDIASLKNLVDELLDKYCREPGNSYVLPPRFAYSHPDNPKYSDDKSRQWSTVSPELKHRVERESVRPIMNAIAELARHRTAADPFLAVEGLSLQIAEEALIPELLGGNCQWLTLSQKPRFGEIDVILFGEHIGAIMIEIKGSKYARDFSGQKMPKRYAAAFQQLDDADSLLFLFEHGAKMQIPATSVRKIVFATGLSKSRYDQWFDGLDGVNASNAKKIIGSTRQWFEDDYANGSIVGKLQELLDETGYSVEPNAFRRGRRILAYLKAWPIFKMCQDDECRKEKLLSLFSERHARMNDVTALQLQQPGIVAENPKVVINDKVIELTLEQATALRGPNRQCVFGTAGTGKSVVLTQRAIDRLELGRSVLVLATESYMQSYRDRLEPAFQIGKPKAAKLEIWSWPKLLWETLDRIPNCPRIIWDIFRREADAWDLASNLATDDCGKLLFRFLDGFDDVIIDDVLEYTISVINRVHTNLKALLVALAMMAYAKEYYPTTKTVWIGLDQKAIEWKRDPYARRYRDTMEKLRADRSMSSSLTCVMRNAEEIFKLAYEHKFARQLEPYKMSCGHKIPGRVQRVTLRPENSSQALELLWTETKMHLDRYLQEQKYKCSAIGIIVGGTGSYDQTDEVIQYLLVKCRESEIPAESLNFRKYHREKITPSTADATPSVQNEDKVLIDFWHQASSKEWPIVIHVEMIDFGRATSSFDAVRIHRQYRARSRAVSELVEICVVPSTSNDELRKCAATYCCTREVEMYDEENFSCLNTSGCTGRYFPSSIHDFHSKIRCPQNNTFNSEKRTERLGDLAKIALGLRADLYRDMHQVEQRITTSARSTYETRLFSKIRKRCYSLSDFRCTNDIGHLALVLDCGLFDAVSRRDHKSSLHHEESQLRKLDEIETYFNSRKEPSFTAAVKKNIINLMERVLWWEMKLCKMQKKEQRWVAIEKQQNILATALDSLNSTKDFSKCVVEVAQSVSPTLAEYLRVNIIELCEGDKAHNYRDSVDAEREIWRH